MLDLNGKVVLPDKKEFEFFKQNNLSNWNFQDFMQHCQLKNRMPLKIDKAISQYKLCLNNIKQCAQDEDVKKYVENLLEEVIDKPTEHQSNTTINNFHNVNYGTTTVMEAHSGATVEQSNKKRKIAEDALPTTHSDGPPLYDSWEDTESEGEIVVEEDIEMNVWDIWKKILDTMQQDGNIEKYSLEHLNIVQLGNKLGSKITREYYPKNLVKRTGLTLEDIPCSFVEDNEFYNNIFDTVRYPLTPQVFGRLFQMSFPQMKYWLKQPRFVSGLFIDNSDVYNSEISYNHYIIWPILNSLSKSIQKTKFSLGETRLEAVSQELKLIHNDNRHYYNADGIISNTENAIEIAILETTGPLFQQNDPKETQDYIKSGYGLVAMLHVTGRKFHYGDFEIFKKIGVFFVQATHQDLESIYASKRGLCG
ncbi:hypothetical protein PS6_011669 [Mucor atramentarius]